MSLSIDNTPTNFPFLSFLSDVTVSTSSSPWNSSNITSLCDIFASVEGSFGLPAVKEELATGAKFTGINIIAFWLSFQAGYETGRDSLSGSDGGSDLTLRRVDVREHGFWPENASQTTSFTILEALHQPPKVTMFCQSGLYKKKPANRKVSMTEKEMMRLSHLPMITIGGRLVDNPHYVSPIESDSDSDSDSEFGDEDKPEITEKPLRFNQTSKFYQQTGKRTPYTMSHGIPESTDSFLPVVAPTKAGDLDSDDDDDSSSLSGSSTCTEVSYETAPKIKKVTRFAHTILEKEFEKDAAFYDGEDCDSCNSSWVSFSSLIGSQYSFSSGRSTKRAWLKKAWRKVY